MKIQFTKISPIIFALLLAVSSVFAQTDANALRQKLQANLDEWHKNAKFAGATVGVCQADGNCFSLATGFSDLETKTPMKPTDISACRKRRENLRGGNRSAARQGGENRSRRTDRKISRTGKMVCAFAERESHHRSAIDESHERFDSIRVQRPVYERFDGKRR